MGALVWILGLCCLATVVVQPGKADEHLPIVLRMQRTVVSPVDNGPMSDPTETCTDRGIACGSCTSVMFCDHNKQIVGSYECSSIDAKRPYCSGKGVCTGTMEDKCKKPSELCPTQVEAKYSFFPVPGNCSEAVYCSATKYATPTTSPSASYAFNFDNQSWSLRKTAADCFEVNCLASAAQNKVYAYKPNPRLYFYCAASGPLTYSCGENEAFNESKRACEFICRAEGKFGIPNGSGGYVENRYYSCLPGANGTVSKVFKSR
uniref:BPTI/Kunitz inhibitor domain-containing protein n=1 Tax=Anopheles epiroticus TaxID=199890 RepID=A0A182P3H9_9DIPT